MVKDILHKTYPVILSLVVISSVLFFFRLGSLALTDPDETFYAETAKEMLERRNWLTPYIYGEPQFEKPIFFYWLVLGSYKLFGVNEFAARLPSAVFALFGVMTAYLLGAALFNKKTGAISAFLVAVNVEYIALARACVTDMTLAVFIGLAFLFFIYGYRSSKGVFYAASSLFMALATLTKGPIGVMLPAAVIVVFLVMKRDLGAVRKMPFVLMSLLFLAVALPWYAYMQKAHGKAFMDMFFGYHNIIRFLEPEHKSGEVWYYYIPVILGGMFPWSVFLPAALWEGLKRAFKDKGAEGGAHIFLAAWFFVFFIFFSLSRTKLPTYIFPAFMPLAVIIGHLWARLFEPSPEIGVINKVKHSLRALLLIIIGASIGAVIYLGASRYAGVTGGAAVSAAVLTAGIALSLVFFEKKGMYLAAFATIVISTTVTFLPLECLVLPEIERHETSREVADVLKALVKPGDIVGAEAGYMEGIAFYTGLFPARLDRHHLLVNFLNSQTRGWCILKEKNLDQLYTLDDKPIHKKPSYIVWRSGKKCIFTNKLPDDGVYLEKKERAR